MYRLYAEFEDDDGRLTKYYLNEYADLKEAEKNIESVHTMLILNTDVIDLIGKKVDDDTFSFYKNIERGRTNGFFHVYIIKV